MSEQKQELSFADTIVPKSDQVNADDLVAGPATCTITKVTRGSDEQPMMVHLDAYPGRPFKPCKGMRRVLLALWGDTATTWAGRRIRIYRNEDVKWGGENVGGIRINGMSDIPAGCVVPVTVSRGKKEKQRVDKLERAKPTTGPSPAVSVLRTTIGDAMKNRKWTKDDIRALLGHDKAEDVPESEHARIIEALKGDPPEEPPVFDVDVQAAAYAALNRGVDPAAIEAALGDRDPKDIPADEAAGVVEKLAALGGVS